MSEQDVQVPADEPQHMWDNPKNVDRFVNGFYVCCVILVLLDFVLHRKPYHPLEVIPAFHALYGFGACWILVVIAKQMRKLLMRDEDYYDGA
jgi:hypothetical protein